MIRVARGWSRGIARLAVEAIMVLQQGDSSVGCGSPLSVLNALLTHCFLPVILTVVFLI